MHKLLILALCVFSQIKEINPSKKWEIEIVTKKRQEFILLTKNAPITVTVNGPTYIRAYTRIFWPKDKQGKQMYKIILQENELDERIISLESERSDVTKDKRGVSLSKWRTFYIEVPEGLNTYKIIHWSSPNDTILVRFSYESPKKWQDIRATEYGAIIESIEHEKIVKYYELKMDENIILNIKGPIKLKVITRLNYDEQMMGEHGYTILVNDNGYVEKHKLRCYKSEITTYNNRKGIIPSSAQTFYVTLKEGNHNVKFNLSGTIGKSAAIRLLAEK